MGLHEELKNLEKVHDDTGVLTIYLNTDLGNGDQQNGEWKIRLKNGLKKLREYIEQDGTKDELKAYKKLADKANQRIYDVQTDMQKSFVFIASADGDIHSEKILQVPVETQFHWETAPVLNQLVEMQSEFPPAGIALVQKSDVVLIDTALGEIRDKKIFNWEIETEDWKQYEGTAAASLISSGSTQIDGFKRRFDENRQRWYKKLAPEIDKTVKKREMQGLYLVGDKEYVQELEKHLGSEVLNVIPKNLISKPDHEVINEVYEENIR
ncbi:VLRF1 family aeRF1-type release factor [Bacillus piscicola]|uniref:VLRF1 family aeRF1-type release factor n=1 Tax=Bacillus piscicola TaxID=1632684 RepID=UPI001F09D957|nr:VLRF1 family aeRF1-type release factor [Bacillus piscicola]